MRATAPIRNGEGLVIGSVRMTMDLAEVQAFLHKTRSTLWAVGGAIAALALALSWVLTTPLVLGTRRLSDQTIYATMGEYIPPDHPRRRQRWLRDTRGSCRAP